MSDVMEFYDDGAIVIHTTRWGTYQARDKDGNGLCSGMDKESVLFWGREHLNGFQNSWHTTTKVTIGGGYKL